MEPLLLVEDKAELRAMLRTALERAGYSVDEAPDGNSAISKIRARRYLLILTDLKLPGRSGIEVLRESKQADPTIPVILVTAFGSVEEAVTALKEVSQQVQRVSATDSTVLLLGESGTGKELFARAVHHLSPRRDHPFVAL